MTTTETFATIKKILAHILDIPEEEISPESYLFRELGTESIDLLEIAVSLNSAFKIEVIDEELFLSKFRLHMEEAVEKENTVDEYLAGRYRFLDETRISEIRSELGTGPALKVKDLARYIDFKKSSR
ncbi:MAG: hypothetical protein GY754_26670 [bacterium]|nr:hypothetical protein [bacterium]